MRQLILSLLVCVIGLASCSSESFDSTPPVGDAVPFIESGPSPEQREAALLIIRRNYE